MSPDTMRTIAGAALLVLLVTWLWWARKERG